MITTHLSKYDLSGVLLPLDAVSTLVLSEEQLTDLAKSLDVNVEDLSAYIFENKPLLLAEAVKALHVAVKHRVKCYIQRKMELPPNSEISLPRAYDTFQLLPSTIKEHGNHLEMWHNYGQLPLDKEYVLTYSPWVNFIIKNKSNESCVVDIKNSYWPPECRYISTVHDGVEYGENGMLLVHKNAVSCCVNSTL